MRNSIKAVALTILLSFGTLGYAATDLSTAAIGTKLVEAEELYGVYSDFSFGKLFTVNRIPAPSSDPIDGFYVHEISIPDSEFRGSFLFRTNKPLKHGDAFEVKRMKRRIENKNGNLRLIIMVELVRKGTDGTNPTDKFFYKNEVDFNTFKSYDEYKSVDGLAKYFNPVALMKRRNLSYAGQEVLEKQH